jgi:hypothetical protein
MLVRARLMRLSRIIARFLVCRIVAAGCSSLIDTKHDIVVVHRKKKMLQCTIAPGA